MRSSKELVAGIDNIYVTNEIKIIYHALCEFYEKYSEYWPESTRVKVRTLKVKLETVITRYKIVI